MTTDQSNTSSSHNLIEQYLSVSNMGSALQESGRYASSHKDPKGPGDARPTSLQILQDNDVICKLQDKVFLVTGGSNGLGVDEVTMFAMTGARVFFTSRDVAKGERVKAKIIEELKTQSKADPRIEIIQMDLQSLESVRSAARDFKSKSDRLDVLVNNAGDSSSSSSSSSSPHLELLSLTTQPGIAMTPHHITSDGWEQQFQVNHLSHFYLFQLLKPLLLSSTTSTFQSRVISVASSAHTMGGPFLGDYNMSKREDGYDPVLAYGQAKTCNIWMANELERRYGSQGLHALSVHPGGILTGLMDSHDESARKMIEAALEIPHIKTRMKSLEQGSASIVLAAVGKEYEGVGGVYLEDCGISPPLPEDAAIGMPGYKPWAYDEEGEKRLWVDSLKFLGLEDD